MYTLSLKNRYGEMLELTHNDNYTITSVTGLGPVKADINTGTASTMDGARFNSSRKNHRNIVINMAIEGDIEVNRLQLYKYAPTKYPVTFYFKNGSRDVYIDGYVESHEINLFENREMAQISIICPKPEFKSTDGSETEFSTIAAGFEFPFAIPVEGVEISTWDANVQKSIINNGDVDTGVIIELSAVGDVVNPVIYNRDTRERFALNITMKESDLITINTNPGEKSVTRLREGVESNIINSAKLDNDWFVLRYGDNVFTYSTDSGSENLRVKMIYTDKYEGV